MLGSMKQLRRTPCTPALVLLVSALALTGIARADENQLNWIGGTSGTHQWDLNANWSSAHSPPINQYPQTTGTHGDWAIIAGTTADRTINTPAVSTLIQRMSWTNPSGSLGVNRLTLNNNLRLNGINTIVWSNSTSSPANMVLDLNGYTFFSAADGGAHSPNNVTFQSTTPGGIFSPRTLLMGTTAVIGANVVISPENASSIFVQGSWHPTSTLRISPGSSSTLFLGGAPVGHFQLGIGGSPSTMVFSAGQQLNTQGDVTIGIGSNLTFGSSSINTMTTPGHYTDNNTTGTYANGSFGTIAFYGSPFIPRLISIQRPALTNHFRVGDNGADLGGSTSATTGNVKLVNDLATSGTFLVRGGSKLDTDTYTVTSGNFTADAGSIFGYSIGSDPGLIQVNGNLTLNAFTLHLISVGGWVNGSDLILMNYTGTLTGSPAVTIGKSPGVFSYDALSAGGGVVKLTNVHVPEPHTLALVALAGPWLFRRRNRAR